MAPFTRRREDDKNAAGERLDATRKGRGEEGLSKIRGPEWGITELDFEGDYNKYQSQEMKREYDRASRGVEPTAYSSSGHKKGQQSVSGQVWMQQVIDITLGNKKNLELFLASQCCRFVIMYCG